MAEMPSFISRFVFFPQATKRVTQLGQRNRFAQIRHGWSIADPAGKAGIDHDTLTALELSKPGMAVDVCFTAQG